MAFITWKNTDNLTEGHKTVFFIVLSSIICHLGARSSSNDIRGLLFSPFFFFHSPSQPFSHRADPQIKNLFNKSWWEHPKLRATPISKPPGFCRLWGIAGGWWVSPFLLGWYCHTPNDNGGWSGMQSHFLVQPNYNVEFVLCCRWGCDKMLFGGPFSKICS